MSKSAVKIRGSFREPRHVTFDLTSNALRIIDAVEDTDGRFSPECWRAARDGNEWLRYALMRRFGLDADDDEDEGEGGSSEGGEGDGDGRSKHEKNDGENQGENQGENESKSEKVKLEKMDALRRYHGGNQAPVLSPKQETDVTETDKPTRQPSVANHHHHYQPPIPEPSGGEKLDKKSRRLETKFGALCKKLITK